MTSAVETFLLSPAGAATGALATGGMALTQGNIWYIALGALLGYFFGGHLWGTARVV